MAAEGERNFGQQAGWTAKWLGVGTTVVGIAGPESLILPGIALGAGGWALEKVSAPKAGARMETSGTIAEFKSEKNNVIQRAADIYLRAGARKSA